MDPFRENKLSIFFQYVSQFRYDKAKDFLDTEKDMLKFQTSSPIYNMLHNLNGLEKSYYSILFFTTKHMFSKKENVKQGYSNLASELMKADISCDAYLSQSNMCRSLADFARRRSQLVDFYESMLYLPQKPAYSLSDLILTLDACGDTTLNAQMNTFNPLYPLTSLVEQERSVLLNLLQAYERISNLYFLEPLVKIQKASDILSDMCPTTISDVSRSQNSLFNRSSPPALINWLCKLKSFLITKYTLYFYNVLSKQAIALDEDKSMVAKDSLALIHKLTRFQNKTNARLLSLIFDAEQETPYLGQGYFLPGTKGDKPTGMDSFPPIFSCPNDPKIDRTDMSSIIMHISGKLNLGDSTEWARTVYAFDTRLERTYFVRKMESRVFLAIIYNGKKNEKDKTVMSFMDEVVLYLRGTLVLNSLKS